MDGETVAGLPELTGETVGILAISPEGAPSWFGGVEQGCEGSGLSAGAIVELDGELAVAIQVYGTGPLLLDPDGPHAERRETERSSVRWTTWIP